MYLPSGELQSQAGSREASIPWLLESHQVLVLPTKHTFMPFFIPNQCSSGQPETCYPASASKDCRWGNVTMVSDT